MKIIGLFDYYFLALMFIQFLISSLIDVKQLKKQSRLKEASALKWISGVSLVVALVMTAVSYLYE